MAESDLTATAPASEPGMLSAAGKAAKYGAAFTVLGAALGAAGAAAAYLSGFDMATVVNGINSVGPAIGDGSNWGSLLATGAAAGGLVGAVTGVTTGSFSGISDVKHYYHEVALPREREQGKAIGAAIEHEAQLHEQAAANYRSSIQPRDASFAAQDAKDQNVNAGIQRG